MTIRPSTRARQIHLEQRAASIARTRCPGAEVRVVEDLIVVRHQDRLGCICIRPSRSRIPSDRRAKHARLHDAGFRVFVCQSEVEIGFALDALPKIGVGR